MYIISICLKFGVPFPFSAALFEITEVTQSCAVLLPMLAALTLLPRLVPIACQQFCLYKSNWRRRYGRKKEGIT